MGGESRIASLLANAGSAPVRLRNNCKEPIYEPISSLLTTYKRNGPRSPKWFVTSQTCEKFKTIKRHTAKLHRGITQLTLNLLIQNVEKPVFCFLLLLSNKT